MHTPDEMLRAGCTTHRGLRFWEDEGLLGYVDRTAGGTRQYTDDQMERARIIAAAQFGGWKLDEIKPMLDEYHGSMAVYDALTTRLTDQIRAAARLGESLPIPVAGRPAQVQEFDL
jgi:DNA-binding transcriptional MerR regulator